MSNNIIKYTINELLSLFTSSDPPEFLCDVSNLFVEESQTPFSQYPKNVSKVTVTPKNTNLKSVKSDPIKNEKQNIQNKVAEFTPKLITQQSDNKIQKSTEFIPSFNPSSVSTSNISKADSLISSPPNICENNIIEENSNIVQNAQPPMDNQINQNMPIFIPQNPPIFASQDPYFIQQNTLGFSSENLPAFFQQYPPGFYPQNFFLNNIPPPFSPPFAPPFSPPPNYSIQTSNPNYEENVQVPSYVEVEQQQLFNPNSTSQNSKRSNIEDQMDGFKSVIDTDPNIINQSNEYSFSPVNQLTSEVPSPTMPSQLIPEVSFSTVPPQSIPEVSTQKIPSQSIPEVQPSALQSQSISEIPNQSQNQHHHQQIHQVDQNRQHNKDTQQHAQQNKNEKKQKGSFTVNTVVEDVKDVKISPWSQVKLKTSQQSFQEIEKLAKTDEQSNSILSMPMVVSSTSQKPSKPSSKMTITNVPTNKNEGGRNKKVTRNPYPLRPIEIPKPADFNVDNIAISHASESPAPPKPIIIYNKNFSSKAPVHNTNNYRPNSNFSITTQSNPTSKPAGFNPGNIAVPPNFANNMFPT